jgi:ribosomal protein S18 acetylase RimI-like enzyme
MDINIIKGEAANLEDCYEALMKSDIGRAYFSNLDARKILIRGLENNEIDVVVDKNEGCIGFLWNERRGAFGTHTYLHMIAIKEEFRGMGVGKRLIAHFEENTFKNDNIIFLMVADFNTDARKLYEAIGYKLIGIIPGFYREGIDEYLMMKSKSKDIR